MDEKKEVKKRKGRPSLEVKREKIIHFRVTVEEEKEINQIAQEKDMNLSDFFRSLIWKESENSENKKQA